METKRDESSHGWIGLETLGGLSADRVTPRTEPSALKRALLPDGYELYDSRFRVEEVLGSGGEGTVYRAFDRVRNKDVALKLLHLEQSASITQLKREFRFLRNLVHPGLVHLHELFVSDEVAFFTMTLVRGRTFLEAARDEATLRRLLVQLADVLEFLHGSGRVHRDIKPSNLLVQEDDELVLVDFGVALDLEAPLEPSGTLVGTPRYLAPEVMRGEPASALSDAYAVGVLLYEALTGRFPFPVAWGLLSPELPPPPSAHVPSVPPDLDALCLALLEPEPTRRADTAHVIEVLNTLDNALPRYSRLIRRGEDTFTGRARELERLEAARAHVLEEREPLLALVEGRSGMGKSALLERFSSFHQDALILSGRCSEHELVPYKVFDGPIESLTEELLERDPEDVLSLLPAAELAALLPLFPELRRVPCIDQLIPDAPLTGELRGARQAGYRALASALRRLAAQRETVLVIDDLQWGDLDSARLLLEIFSGIEPPPCLIVLGFRTEEAKQSPCLRTLLEGRESLVDKLRSLRVELGPLEQREARTLLARAARETTLASDIVEEILTEAKGTPLLLTELARELGLVQSGREDDAKGVLGRVVAGRVARLDPRAQRAFSLLACADVLETAVLAALSGLDGDTLVQSLESARLARPRQGGRRLQVLHDAIREAHLAALGERSEELHRSLAEELERRRFEPARVARHYFEGGAPELASVAAERAANLASQGLAFTQAVELYRRALAGEREGTERHRRLEESLADALADAGYGSEAAPLFARLARSARPAEALRLRSRAAAQWLSSGDIERGWAELVEVHESVGLSWPETRSRAILQVILQRTAIRVLTGGARSGPPAVVSPEDELRLGACRAAWSVSYVSMVHGAANSARYLALALRTKHPEHLAFAFGMETLYRATAGTHDREKIERFRSAAIEATPKPIAGYRSAFMHYVAAQSHYLMGEFAESTLHYESAELELSQCRDVAWELSSGRTFWGSALTFLGRHRELDRRLIDWIQDARERSDLYGLTAFELHRLRRRGLREGNHADVVRELDETVERWRSPYVGVHYSLAIFIRAHTMNSWRRPDLALQSLEAIGLRSSMLSRVQVVRVSRLQALSLTRLTLATKSQGSARADHVARTLDAARALRREKATWASTFAEHAEANVAWLNRPDEESLARLERVREEYRALGFELYVAALDVRIGALRGGDEGNAAIRRGLWAFRSADCNPAEGALLSFAPELPS